MGRGRDEWSAVREVANDRRSGAREVALRAAEALTALPRRDLEEAVRNVVMGHPSMAPLWRLGTEVLAAADHASAAAAFARRIMAEPEGVAAAAAPLLRSPALVLHSYSSTLVVAVASSGARLLCARSDPGGEGAVTVRRLREMGLGAELVTDDDALAAAAEGTPVVTGADAIGPSGVVNKVGTAALAAAARDGGGGCVVAAGSSKLVAADLPAPAPFERAPLTAFAALVTDRGRLDAPAAAEAAGRYPLAPALAGLLRPA